MNEKAQKKSVPKLADVAKLAKVSTATVSRCLNSPDKVDEKTRKIVLKAVDELGYAPNFGAQALAAQRTNTVGAIIPTMDNAIFARGLQSFQEELNTQGLTLLVASSAYDPKRESEQIKSLVARGADALLLIGYDRNPEIYKFLEQRGVTTLLCWAYSAKHQRPSIGFDNRRAQKDIVLKALEMGHRKLAYISARSAHNDRARERILGARDAMVQYGLDPNAMQVVETDYTIYNGGQSFAHIWAQQSQPTAVICGNDVLAVGAVNKAKELGLTIPSDVSITGFDDIEISEIVSPALTTVHVPHRRMGARAAQVLIDALQNGKAPQLEAPIETSIVMRDTLAPPRLD